ncbi:CopD family protein [Streptomyces sp. NPDC001478]
MIPNRAPATGRRRPGTTVLVVAGAALCAVAVALLGTDAAGRGTGELRIPGAGTAVLLRTALFAAFAVHIGTLALGPLVRSVPDRPRTLPPSWAVAASVVGALAAAGQIARLARISGLGLVETYGTREGGLLLLVANGFALAACCAASRRPALAAAPLALAVGAEALRAHPEADTPLVGAALTVVHLTAASLWAGGLLQVLRTLRHWRPAPAPARALLGRYARLAVWPYAALAVTGTCSALRRLPAEVVFTSAYGRTLLVKLALMAVVSVLALAARRRLGRDGGGPEGARRAALGETVALAAVVLVSAVLTVVPDPHWIATR